MKCLYLTYDGLLDPLGQSQVIPYVQSLVAGGHSFTLISFEKEGRDPGEVAVMERRLAALGVSWLRASFRRTNRLEFARRMLAGAMLMRRAARAFKPDMVHLRGHTPAIIYGLSGLRIPHLYDYRGFALQEWADSGKVKGQSLGYRLLRLIERRSVERASGLVVLEKSAEVLLRELYHVPPAPLRVIRTCTDISRYRRRPSPTLSDPVRFVFLGSARRPYRPDLALRLLKQFITAGIDCRIDFINEGDSAEIDRAIQATAFPAEKTAILRLAHDEVPEALARYDCGLIFYEITRWKRVSSPTKLGEYLAAGLPVIGIEGVDVLDDLAQRSRCVRVVSEEQTRSGKAPFSPADLKAFIGDPDVPAACQELASREFSLAMAGELYASLYSEIGRNLSLCRCIAPAGT